MADAAHIPLEVAERWRINVILSLLAFFFAKDGREMQSFHRFLSEAIGDDRLPETEVKRAFGMNTTDEFEKTKFEAAKKKWRRSRFQKFGNRHRTLDPKGRCCA